MRIIEADRDTLARPLQAISGIVERRHTLPILSNVLLERNRGKLCFTATDLEVQVVTASHCDNDDRELRLTTSARKLLDILRALPEGEKVALDANDRRLQVQAGKSKFSLQTLPAEDFPKLAAAGQTISTITIAQRELKNLLTSVQYAMAQQDIRYYLNGVLLIADNKTLTAVATDGHRLALAKLAHDDVISRQEIILPRKAALELMRLLGEKEDPVTVELSEKQIRFMFSDIALTSKLIDGKFPDYTRVIPANQTNRVKLDRSTFQKALQRAAILSNEKFRGVRLMLTADKLSIVCSNSEQEEAHEELDIEYKGAPLDIGFNISYLLDVLNYLTCEEVDCALGDANSSVLITAPGNSDFQYVVMPMRI